MNVIKQEAADEIQLQSSNKLPCVSPVSHPEHLRPNPVQRPAVTAVCHSTGETTHTRAVNHTHTHTLSLVNSVVFMLWYHFTSSPRIYINNQDINM